MGSISRLINDNLMLLLALSLCLYCAGALLSLIIGEKSSDVAFLAAFPISILLAVVGNQEQRLRKLEKPAGEAFQNK